MPLPFPYFKHFAALFATIPNAYLLYSLFLQREGAEDILDFWLDVQQHENLCRAYFKDIRKSGRNLKEEWPEYWDYARRRGSIYGTVVGMGEAKRSTGSMDHLMTGDDEKYRPRSTSPRPGASTALSDHTRVASASPRATPLVSLLSSPRRHPH